MDFYAVFKFLHVLTVLAWVGGGMTLLASSLLTMRSRGDEAVLQGLETLNGLGKVWFIPASLLTVIFGAIATTIGGMWGQLWVLLGLAGFASTFLVGLLFVEPMGRRCARLVEEKRIGEAIYEGRRLMSVAKFDYTVMLVIVADMVVKPYWTDFAVLGIFAAVIAAGAIVFLLPALRSEAVTA